MSLEACESGGVGGDRAGMEQPTGGLTFDPDLERDLGLSSNTILPAYSPRWLPAATHKEALWWGLSGQKGPLERWLPSGGFSRLYPPSMSGLRLERVEKLNNREDTRDTIVFREYLNPQQTVSTSVRRQRIDRHSVGHRQKGSFPCGQSHWKGYSVVLLCMRGIWSPSLFSCSWTTLWSRWNDFVSLESRGKRWSKASREGPFFTWPAPLEGWKRLLSYTSSKKMHQSRRRVWPGLKKRRVDVTRRGWTWTHVACVCVFAEATHKPRRVGVYWILVGCLGKTLSFSLFFCLILSEACGLLSCEHTASIKDLFIFLFGLSFASRCKKGLFTEATASNSRSSQFICYCQLDLTRSLW